MKTGKGERDFKKESPAVPRISAAFRLNGNFGGGKRTGFWMPGKTLRLVIPTTCGTESEVTNVTLVFSSSSLGDEYIGSVDSELLVDEVTLTLTTLPE